MNQLYKILVIAIFVVSSATFSQCARAQSGVTGPTLQYESLASTSSVGTGEKPAIQLKGINYKVFLRSCYSFKKNSLKSKNIFGIVKDSASNFLVYSKVTPSSPCVNFTLSQIGKYKLYFATAKSSTTTGKTKEAKFRIFKAS